MESMITTKTPANSLRFLLYILVISSCLFATDSFGGKKMKPLYNISEARELKPQKYDTGESTSLSLFPVPQDNSIGTNDLNNAITLISFHKGGLLSSHKDRISFDKYFKNAVNDIGGGGQYLPVISKDVIGFGQTRAFVIYDFKKKIHREFTIVASLAKTIEKVAIADARRLHFIFEIEGHNSRSHDPWDTSSTLQLMDLSGQNAKLIKEIKTGGVTIWSILDGKNFLYDLNTKKVHVLNMNLEPAHHPLADIINHNNGKFSFTRMNAHPYLPFALLSGGKNDEVLVSWDQGRDKSPISIFGDSATASQFSFSPDGKWVVFKEGGAMDSAKTYLMPVSEKYPHYLGSPILLANYYFNEINFAWTTNPISFVGSSGNEIYRWELTNVAHPESKKATFHDYIVEHDLEKLTKEKRQGLGQKHK